MSDPSLDPDRFFGFENSGSQEWWYFDAISDDGRDALVIVWYMGLPFDPRYGVSAARHYRNPVKYPATRPSDYCAVGLSWYRDGKTVAYALNHYGADRVKVVGDPFSVTIGPTSVDRAPDGEYRHKLRTPHVDRKAEIIADLRFRPAAGTEPIERDLGGSGSPHYWLLAAADCRVEGTVELVNAGKNSRHLDFKGRGYHDHNAGLEEISIAWRRWRWGRVHFGPHTMVYYQAEPKKGRTRSLSVLLRDGRPERIRDNAILDLDDWKTTGLGVRYARNLAIPGAGEGPSRVPWLARRHRHLVDGGPFYLRWLSEFEIEGRDEPALGISELLEANRLNRPWFNWMIPFRLKRY